MVGVVGSTYLTLHCLFGGLLFIHVRYLLLSPPLPFSKVLVLFVQLVHHSSRCLGEGEREQQPIVHLEQFKYASKTIMSTFKLIMHLKVHIGLFSHILSYGLPINLTHTYNIGQVVFFFLISSKNIYSNAYNFLVLHMYLIITDKSISKFNVLRRIGIQNLKWNFVLFLYSASEFKL